MAKKPKAPSERTKMYRALKVLGEQITKRQHTKTYQKILDRINKQRINNGEDPLDIEALSQQYTEFEYEKAPRDENMQTEPLKEDLDEESAKEYLEEYNQKIDDIYNDTYSWIKYGTRKGVQHDEGHLPSIADYRKSELDDEYWTLKAQLQSMMQDIPPVILAKAIKANAELDYTTAITELGPSDIQVEFERTLGQLIAINTQIDKRAKELAIEEEEKAEKGTNYR